MGFRLEKQTGPECPGCQSQSTVLVSVRERWGRPSASFRCRRCERRFTLAAEGRVEKTARGAVNNNGQP